MPGRQPFQLADGEPYIGDMVAVVDESTPNMGAGIYYVVSTAVLINHREVRAAVDGLFADTPGRSRPFHWHREGPAAKRRIIDIIADAGIVAHSRYRSVGRRGQAAARPGLLISIAEAARQEGASHLIIESGDDHTNERDRDALLGYYEPAGGVPFGYDWRTKREPLLWLADAVSGAISDHFTGEEPVWFAQLTAAGIIGSPEYP